MTGGSESWLSIGFKFFNFALLVGILVKFVGKPLKNYLAGRQKEVKERLEEANKALKEAQDLKAEYEKRLSNLDKELELFKKATMEEAEKERDRIIADAKEFASKIKAQVIFTYEQEAREVRMKIKEEIANLTIERAEKLISDTMTKEDHRRLVEDFIEKMRSLN